MREIGMANTELGIDNTFSDIAKLENNVNLVIASMTRSQAVLRKPQ